MYLIYTSQSYFLRICLIVAGAALAEQPYSQQSRCIYLCLYTEYSIWSGGKTAWPISIKLGRQQDRRGP